MDNLGTVPEAAGSHQASPLPILPQDLLLHIFQQRDHQGRQVLTLEDHVRGQAVCRAWRDALGRSHLPIQALNLCGDLAHSEAIAEWAVLRRPAVETVQVHWGNRPWQTAREAEQLALFFSALFSIRPLNGRLELEMSANPLAPMLHVPAQLPGLTRLCIYSGAEAPNLHRLGRLQSLQSLSLRIGGSARLAGPGLSLPSLTSLDILGVGLVEVSTTLPLLRRLCVRAWRASGLLRSVARIAAPQQEQQAEREQHLDREQPFLLPCLEELSIAAFCPQVDLALAPVLTSLQLKRFHSLAGVRGLGNLPRLASLRVEGLKGDGLSHLEAASLLREAPPTLSALSLDVQGCCVDLHSAIAAATQLTELRLCGGTCTQLPTAVLQALPQLRSLSLGLCPAIDLRWPKDLIALKAVAGLRCLTFEPQYRDVLPPGTREWQLQVLRLIGEILPECQVEAPSLEQ